MLHKATDQTNERLDVSDEKTDDSRLFNTDSWHGGRLVLLYMIAKVGLISAISLTAPDREYRETTIDHTDFSRFDENCRWHI